VETWWKLVDSIMIEINIWKIFAKNLLVLSLFLSYTCEEETFPLASSWKIHIRIIKGKIKWKF
jgi:hypothetical protein